MQFQQILDHFEKINGGIAPTPDGKGFLTYCPVHGDTNPSLHIELAPDENHILCVCRSHGCPFPQICEKSGLKQSDWFINSKAAGKKKSERQPPTLTLYDYASSKKFDPGWLEKIFGLKQGQFSKAGIHIPYKDVSGMLVVDKIRNHLKPTGDPKNPHMHWPKGKPAMAFNLPALARAEKKGVLAICEGETDTFTAELYGYPAIGLSGSQQVKTLPIAEIMERKIKRLLIMQDNDEPGQILTTNIHDTLKKAGWDGKLQVLQLPEGVKDLNELHLQGKSKKLIPPKEDQQAFREILKNALIDFNKLPPPPPPPIDPEIADGPEPQREMHEVANAKRFVDMHGDKVRWVQETGEWIIWDGRHWAKDRKCEIIGLAKQTIAAITREVDEARGEDPDRAKLLWKHYLKSNTSAGINAMLALSRDQLAISSSLLDRDAHLLNFANGTVDLKTGKLLDHDRKRMITRLLPFDYDLKAPAPRWRKFIKEIFKNQVTLIRYVCRVAGYSCTAAQNEKALFYLHGGHDNGKTTFIEVIFGVLGNAANGTGYAEILPKNSVIHQTHPGHGGAASPDMAKLKGVRFVKVDELDERVRLDEAKLKMMTGMDTLTARPLYREPINFTPSHHLWLLSNYLPIIVEHERAIWDRVKIIPFDVTFERGKRIDDLKDRILAEEKPGVAAWLVDGAVAWHRSGLQEPKIITEKVKRHREDMDALGTFLRERCKVGPDLKVQASHLYNAYRAWAQNAGEFSIMNARIFGMKLPARGFTRKHTMTGETWLGVDLDSTKDKM